MSVLVGAPVHAAPVVDQGGAGSRQVLAARPNIVLLLVDDLGAIDDRLLERLPNIRATFLERGVRFTNYWANFSLCCPGRAALLSGQRNDHNGVIKNDARLFDPNETIATELDALGYRTGIIGKYFNGASRLVDKTPPGWDYVAIKDEGPYYDYPVWVNGVRELHADAVSDYSTTVMAAKSIPFFADASTDVPLFAYLTPNAPHGGSDELQQKVGHLPVPDPRFQNDDRCAGIEPWKSAAFNELDVADKPAYVRGLLLLPYTDGWDLTRACEALFGVDDWLGQVEDLLIAQGRYQNTIFVLSSDNGMGWGSHRIEGKIAPYTAQMPLFVTWPAMMAGPPRSDSTLLSNIDIAPTLCEIAGCTMGPYPNGHAVDGQSFAGLIAPSRFASRPVRDSIIIEGQGGYVPPFRAIMTAANHPLGQWLLIVNRGGFEELYDMSGGECAYWHTGAPGDPCMMSNVAHGNPAVRKALMLELTREWLLNSLPTRAPIRERTAAGTMVPGRPDGPPVR